MMNDAVPCMHKERRRCRGVYKKPRQLISDISTCIENNVFSWEKNETFSSIMEVYRSVERLFNLLTVQSRANARSSSIESCEVPRLKTAGELTPLKYEL